MSTYRRPSFLRHQLELLLQQTFPDFLIIISDNDPECSARAVVEESGDPRLRYFPNQNNLGMVRSFNKSLERSNTEFVVMVTDDDPVDPSMLKELLVIADRFPGYGIYSGCRRRSGEPGTVEVFDKDNFVFQLLHPDYTISILWSSCLLRREAALAAGGMAEYGSPHLADHALLALCSRTSGGVMVNRMYSEFSSHPANFSKSNFDLYYIGCREFHKLIAASFPVTAYFKGKENALTRHLEVWFIAMAFNLRRFYTYEKKDRKEFHRAVDALSKILTLPFMKRIYLRYEVKRAIFYLKWPLFRLGVLKNRGL